MKIIMGENCSKMDNNYKTFFGLKEEPFRADLKLDNILQTENLKAVKTRFDYTVRLGGAAAVTGEIGSGKTTALRYASEVLHPSEYRVVYITATSGPILELYRQICTELAIGPVSRSKAAMTGIIKKEIRELTDGKKMKVILIIDEASQLRLEVLSELHTITQFNKDSRLCLPVILAGQGTLVDKLRYRTSAPLASRIVARSHLKGLNRDSMEQYISHHLELAGGKAGLFEDAAMTAVHQGAGGLLRKANHLARGAMMAAAHEKSQMVNAEHVRLAATEVF